MNLENSEFDEKFFSEIPLGDGVVLEMIRVKAGTFMMGSPEDELGRDMDETLHRVTLTQDYWLGKFQVTQVQFEAVTKYNPSHFEGSNRPVEMVSWGEAKAFCDTLNDLYSGKLPAGYRFDLPTEAQWEYACRAGKETAYFWGNICNGIEANFDDKDSAEPVLGHTVDVGCYKPNEWGFYDMHGNVFEWCRDWYAYYNGDEIDPVGPSDGTDCVIRGGSWFYFKEHCRSAYRSFDCPISSNFTLGFRVALVPVD